MSFAGIEAKALEQVRAQLVPRPPLDGTAVAWSDESQRSDGVSEAGHVLLAGRLLLHAPREVREVAGSRLHDRRGIGNSKALSMEEAR